MQSKINKQTAPVHIKVARKGEFRRFLLTEPTFSSLETTIKSLYSLDGPVTLKFLDDEKDWVLLTNDSELLYAIDLSGSPLRVDIIETTAAPVTAVAPAQESVQPQSEFVGWRGRGGKRGRGCARGGKNVVDRLEERQVRIACKIADLEEKLKSGELSSERERTVRWKLSQWQEKLAFVTAKRASLLATPPEESRPTEVCTEEVQTETTPEMPPAKGRRGRGGRGCRGGRGEGREGEPCRKGLMKLLPPEFRQDILQKKAALKAAKEGGNPDEINACKEALWQAKEAKFAALSALKAERANEDTA
jgi:hypothetical protein